MPFVRQNDEFFDNLMGVFDTFFDRLPFNKSTLLGKKRKKERKIKPDLDKNVEDETKCAAKKQNN